MASVTESNILQITDPIVPFWDFPHLMSPNDDEWRVGIFSNSPSVPVPNLSTEHSQVDRWLSGFWFKRSTTKINSFLHFSVRRKNTRGWGWKYNFRLEISVVCPIYRGLSFSCHCTKIVTLDNVSQSTKVRVKETSKSLWLQTLWWAPLQTYFLQKFSCNSYIILQQTNKTFTAFANYFSKPDIFTDFSLKSVMFACSK